ncbi:hypothetical protein [Rickettsia rickettsii]|uniref:Uncharacterized protein n=2 Tax=spotted fever group TaxID=114277 RepID=A0A0H3AW67_RICRS|nr:hypothetical protein A1G_02845 [Rickettsia rickettsii str. 'Sheila Smith']AFB26138.1 hypothetical protein RSA_02790 [Rickettsia philipii str. 364D]AFB30143.1 hypothetical protein RPM_02810 [Rickettsia rickettsii str. Hauke]
MSSASIKVSYISGFGVRTLSSAAISVEVVVVTGAGAATGAITGLLSLNYN